ncbi:MAG: hypothetical protein WC423_26685 [Vulcanimicrobiota bacterium]
MKKNPRWLPRVWELPPEIVERLGRQVGRQRSIYEKGHLLVILHALPKPGQDEREARVFWRAPDGNWKSNSGKGTGALAAHIAEYQAAIEELEQRENSAQSSEDFFSVLEIANPLARSSRNMHLALQQARDLVTEDSELISLRDEAYGVERGAELLVIDIRNGFDLYVARKTEEMTKSSHSMALAGHRLNLGHARADIARFSESTAR